MSLTSAKVAGRYSILEDVTVDPPSVNGGSFATVNVTLARAKAGQMFLVRTPTLTAGLAVVRAQCTTDGTVVCTLANHTAGAVNDAAQTWTFIGV